VVSDLPGGHRFAMCLGWRDHLSEVAMLQMDKLDIGRLKQAHEKE
jgi:hypothetical protein